MWTPLVTLCLASALSMPASSERIVAGEEVFAWVLGETGVESPRFAPLLVMEDLEPSAIVDRFASTPPGRRGLVSRELLNTIAESPSDHVVVAGRITDHPGPWLDRGTLEASEAFASLAKRLAAASQSVDLLLVGGENPISAEKLDTTDDLVWIAIRNDARFDEVRTADLTLEGAMTPSSGQWSTWNDFADGIVHDAVERSIEGLRKTSPHVVVVCPPAGDSSGSGIWAVDLGLRDDAIGSGATMFDEARDQIASAIERSADGTVVVPRVLPHSHPGSSTRRSFVAGTAMWDELVRHGLLLGDGTIVYVDDRATADPEDGLRLDGILKDVSERPWSGTLLGGPKSDRKFRSGTGFFASGVGTGDDEMVWRITFAPGFTRLTVDVDGSPTVVRRESGRTGGWFVHDAGLEAEFATGAERHGGDPGDLAGPASTGGGLVPSDEPVKGASFTTADAFAQGSKPVVGADPFDGDSGNGASGFVEQDLNGDGVIDGADQAIWLSGGSPDWNGSGWEDLNGDGIVDGADLATELAGDGEWNGAGWEDLNGDEQIDGADLAIRLSGGAEASAVKPKVGDAGGRVDIRVRQWDEPDGDSGDGGWTGTDVGDLNGDGIVDGADLAIGLSGRGGLDSSGGDDDADSSSDDTSDDTGTTDAGTPPSVDPTIPIGDGTEGETTPPTQNSTVTVLYDGLPNDAIVAGLQANGIERYIIVYEGVDPDARTTGLIDADRVVQHIRTKHGDSPSGYGVLDFENPFFERMSAGPEDPHYQSTVSTIVALLDRVRAEFPNVKWTMYGMPRVKYWGPVGSYGWATAEGSAREEMLSYAVEAFRPVLEHCDWLNPSVYDRYELERQNESSWQMWTERETAWRRVTVDLCKRFNESHDGPAKPIIPMVSPLFFKVGQIEYNMKYMSDEELLRDQIRPVMEAGADGIAFWTGYNFWTHAATSDEDLGWHQEDARNAMGLDYFTTPPSDWADSALRLDLQQRVSERVRDSLQVGRQEIQSILDSQIAGVPES
jgi:hypothetical protein